MQRAQLVARLEAVPDFTTPHAGLEQYLTPAQVAADLLWHAHEDGAVAGRDVLDLGCGTGIFSMGARLLGAKTVTGVDMDPEALAIAQELVDGTFIEADVRTWQPPHVDTVLMNPPFGAQKRGADRPFYACAAKAVDGGTCWFLAQPKTERFLAAQARELGADLERVQTWDYPIEARFAFHGKRVASFHVAGYRMAW